MNFLAHDCVLGTGLPPLAHVGATLPDLWPLVSTRPLPLLVLRRLRARTDPEAAALAYGIAHHMHVDAVFHGHPVFAARVDEAAGHLEAHLGDTPRHPELAAHVLVEMLLDHWLLERDPALVDVFYARFSDAACRYACERSSDEPQIRGELAAVLARFTTSRFLADYATPAGLAGRLVRTLQRVGGLGQTPPDVGSLAGAVDALRVRFASGSAALLDEVAARVAGQLRGAGLVPPRVP